MKQDTRAHYPWEKWTNGQWWHLEQGIDFFVKAPNFKVQAKNWGNSHGYITEARVTQGDDGVLVRFTPA